MKEFDYYIYIDYSEGLIGYIIIEKNNLKEILSKISKLHHYKKIRHKKEYLSAMNKRFLKEGIKDLLLRWKIKDMRLNLEIFIDVIGFVKKNDNCIIFISVDNNQYYSFMKLLDLVPHKKHLIVRKESELKIDSIEYRLSLIIDTMLNFRKEKAKMNRVSRSVNPTNQVKLGIRRDLFLYNTIEDNEYINFLVK